MRVAVPTLNISKPIRGKKMLRLIILLSLFPMSAFAIDYEFSAGRNQYKLVQDGTWYQEAYPHSIDLKDVAWSVGISHKFSGYPRVRAEYVDLGRASADALSISSDDDYDINTHKCTSSNPKRCEPIAHFSSHGTVKGLAFTIAPEWSFGPVSAYIEGGIFVYQPSYSAHVVGMEWVDEGVKLDPYTIKHKMTVESTYTFGAGIKYKNVDVSVRYYDVEASDDDVAAIYIGATTLMMRVMF